MRLLGIMKRRNRPGPRNIRRWLRRQAWHRSFLGHIRWNHDLTLWDKILIAGGFYGIRTIPCAFDWTLTVEGTNTWCERFNSFIKWYMHEYGNEEK